MNSKFFHLLHHHLKKRLIEVTRVKEGKEEEEVEVGVEVGVKLKSRRTSSSHLPEGS